MKILLTVATAAVLLCSAQCAPFTARVSTKREQKLGEDVACEVTITNTHQRDYHLLARNTPLEGLRSAIFSISHNGKKLPYDGMLLKRGPLSKEESVPIRAESSLISSVDLSRVYSFVSTGAYKVQLKMWVQYFEDEPMNISTQQVLSNVEVITLTESENQPKLTEGELARRNTTRILLSPSRAEAAISPRFAGTGTSGDKATAITAYNAAYNTLYKSYQSVTGNPSLYSKWFGLAYSGYMKTVEGNYLNIKSAMETYVYTLYFYGSSCRRGVVAYTHHYDTTLYLCDGYVNAPTVGSDSKMGTIVHEMSHAVAITEDIKYGTYECQKLATNSPSEAINNADNYEYFSEAQ